MGEQSDNIEPMCTQIPLIQDGEFRSPTMYLGDYESISLVIKGSHDCVVTVEFSGDGYNPDWAPQFACTGGVTLHETLPIMSKYVTLLIDSVVANQTYLRAFTYGTIKNTVT